jgi:hypothetical protein
MFRKLEPLPSSGERRETLSLLNPLEKLAPISGSVIEVRDSDKNID